MSTQLTTDDIRIFLIAFLVDNDCYERFVINLSKIGKYEIRSIEELINFIHRTNGSYYDAIGLAFTWAHTLEGGKFWLDINRKYMAAYAKLTYEYFSPPVCIHNCKSIW